tara:strand:- start:3809 stop:4366 length:558 start_codon:yes stop_codon:yes gene_type:complete
MKLTSSEFAAAMGICPYSSRQKLFRIKKGTQERDPMNDFMQWGIDNEFKAVASAEAITGKVFKHTGDRQKHYVMATSEGEYGTTPDGSADYLGLEVKCPQSLKDDVPVHYLPQLQGQMWIAGFSQVLFLQWTEEESRAWMVQKSDDYIFDMKQLLKDFRLSFEENTEPKRRKKPVLPFLTIERVE